MTPLDLRRYRAERLLRKDFAGLRSKVLAIVRSQLRAKGVKLDPADLEACYAQAWHGLYATLLKGEAVESPSAWLVRVTFRRAIDEHRSARGARVLDGEEYGSYPGGSGASAQDFATELDDRARLRQVFEGLRTRLSGREREAASLCYLQGLSRAEAAERMGISEARMRKLMEGAGAGRPGVASKVGDLLKTIKAEGWCEQQSSLMKAYAFGILDPAGERYALAVAHCRECSACRAHVASLRGLASVLPLPLLVLIGGKAPVGKRSAGSGTSNAGRAVPGRLAANAPRFGGRAGAGGWGGLSGSLAAKLAVTAAILLGGGYAVLGSRAHGSPSGPPVLAGVPAAAAPASVLAPASVPASVSVSVPAPASVPAALIPAALLPAGEEVLTHALFGVPYARTRARAGHPKRGSTTPSSRRLRAAPLRSGASPIVGSHEFGPERAGLAPTAPPARSAAQIGEPAPASGAGSTTAEFGLE